MNALTTVAATLTTHTFFAAWDAVADTYGAKSPEARAAHIELRPLLDGSSGVRGTDDGDTCLSVVYYFPAAR